MALSVILFAIGVFLVVKGGDLFVDAAAWLAQALGVPSYLIGATIVSLATTMPELLVSVVASAGGQTDMAVGNAVGSVIANTGLILGIAMLAMPVVIRRSEMLWPALLLLAAGAVLWIACRGGHLAPWGAVVLITICAAAQYLSLRSGRSGSQGAREKVPRAQLGRRGLLFLLGAVGIVVGSQLLVNGGSGIAAHLGVPERIIAVTLVAVGTSLPELVTTISAAVKRQAGLSVGNLIGANLLDLTLILPLSSLAAGGTLSVPAQSAALDLPVNFALLALALLPLLARQKGSRLQGLLLLGSYAVFLIVTL